MGDLYAMVSVFNRHDTDKFLKLYEENNVSVNIVSMGLGTAINRSLETTGLADVEKVVITSFVTFEAWETIKEILTSRISIEMMGTGIAFIVPMSSVGGKSQLGFLVAGQDYKYKGESELKNTEYELLVVISEAGYSDEIMDAARKGGAGGGTIIHAKGTGNEDSQSFLGVTLAAEKEMIYIVVKSSEKNAIMKAVMDEAGLNSDAKSIVFSLPVTATAGIRF